MLAKTAPQWAGAKLMFGFAQGITVATVPVVSRLSTKILLKMPNELTGCSM